MDYSLLSLLNGSDSLFLDQFALTATDGWTWAALYAALLIMVIKNNQTSLHILLIIVGVALTLLLSAGVTDLLVKPYAGRLRPTYDENVAEWLQTVNGYLGDGPGFFSAHAANTMGVAVFFMLLTRSGLLSMALLLWSLLNCWTRLYLGVHFPSDILAGLLWGALSGTAGYLLFRKLFYMMSPKINYVSSQYTVTGYSIRDIWMVVSVWAFTLLYCVIRALI